MADLDIIMSKLQSIEDRISSIPQPAAVIHPEIIDTNELCRRMSISEVTAVKWRRKKKIPIIKLDNVIRYNWPAVVEALERKGNNI